MCMETAITTKHLGLKIRAIWATIRLLHQVDTRTFIISTSTGIMESLFYPLLLLIVWKGFSLVMASGGQGYSRFSQGAILAAALFGVLAIQHLLRIVNDTAT